MNGQVFQSVEFCYTIIIIIIIKNEKSDTMRERCRGTLHSQ